jgi:phosphatidylethanolamine/phosphatidyl-N-methylethanolamine N-methyltransferase
MISWNRIRYTVWAPIYDAIAGAAGFGGVRRRSIDRLRLEAGHRVLIQGAGTGLDLEHLPAGVAITAIDITPAMLARLERRAARLGLAVEAHVMDARQLTFPDAAFDAVILHLVLAVMPEPERGLREAERVLKPGGRVAVFDKFLRDDESPSLKRRLLNLVSRPLFTDVNRRLGPLVGQTRLVLEHDEPAAFAGWYRVATLRKGA